MSEETREFPRETDNSDMIMWMGMCYTLGNKLYDGETPDGNLLTKVGDIEQKMTQENNKHYSEIMALTQQHWDKRLKKMLETKVIDVPLIRMFEKQYGNVINKDGKYCFENYVDNQS